MSLAIITINMPISSQQRTLHLSDTFYQLLGCEGTLKQGAYAYGALSNPKRPAPELLATEQAHG